MLLFRCNINIIILTIKFDVPNMTFITVYVQEGKTPLFVASKEGYSEIVRLLLNANANTDIANNVSCLLQVIIVFH